MTLIEKGRILDLNDLPKIDEENNRMSKVPYDSYCTRLDTNITVGMVSQLQSNPELAY